MNKFGMACMDTKSLIGGLEIGPWAHPLCVSVGAVQLEHAETI